MQTTILFAHPWHGSFNKSVLDRVTAHLDRSGEPYTVIDLNKDGFNPAMSERDLELYARGESADPLVGVYNAILDRTERLILVFPIWWYDMPAILRGFFDKVILSGSSYIEDERGMHPLRKVRETVLFTTSSAPTESLIRDFGDPVNGTIIAGTFRSIGFEGARWYNLGGMNGTTEAERTAFLDEIPSRI